ncbi:30S ribosomal protein S4 [Candidatus Parcubacteria bacterium]|jgi:small subunit ribosomal protein S4|nr:30S ribosomal protein S4 [Candidatus Parcubacteria bacterium]
MGRNLKPRHKASRRFGENVADTAKSPLAKKPYPPGMHGPKKTFAKVSEYGRQLKEKQKAKAIYGLLEKQFRLTFSKASKMTGEISSNLLLLLETRLDNVIFRSGLAPTRRLARQLVTHAHFTVDGVKTNIPSYRVKPGQVIKLKENKLKKAYWAKILEKIEDIESAGWLTLDKKEMSITISSLPNKEELPQNIETHLIIDFYSR